ncbi:MAG: hypothetical protein VZQ27_05290 [Candidatus Cryptobacteroides sp.]|nr:hypothetical protein [Candidatus Cryptobacteroides sp.]
MKNRLLAAIVLNILIIIGEMIAVPRQFSIVGWPLLKYYTYLSNILLGIVSILFVIYAAKSPLWLKRLRLLATGGVAMTLTVVLAVLAPSEENGYFTYCIQGDGLWVHTICPLLSIISFIFAEDNSGLKYKDCLLPLGATLLYGVVAITLNLLRLLYGPYFFLHVYEQPIYVSIFWVIVLMVLVYVLAVLQLMLSRRCSRSAAL